MRQDGANHIEHRFNLGQKQAPAPPGPIYDLLRIVFSILFGPSGLIPPIFIPWPGPGLCDDGARLIQEKVSAELSDSLLFRTIVETRRNRAMIVWNRCVLVCGHRAGYLGLGLASL